MPWRLREGDATDQPRGGGDAPPPKRPRPMAGESAAAKRPRMDAKLEPGAVEVHGVGGRLAEALADGDSNVFAVERILGERRRSGRAQFLIRWLGCAPAEASPTPSARPAHAQPTPRPRLACASRTPPVPACDQGRPTDRSVLRGRFDASHDSWELEDNVSEGLAAAFRKGRRTQPSEHTPANLLASNAAASRKELREQYGAGDLGPAPKRRQRDGESSHEAEEERRPPSGAPFEPKTLLPDDVKAVLTQWCLDNIDSPYPNEREKHEICAVTHLTFTQVNNWCVACDARICALSRSAPCLHAVSNAYAPLPLGVTSLCRRHPHTHARLTACCPRTGLPTGASASGRRSRPTIERRRASSVGRVAQAMLMGRRPSLRRRRRAARATAEH